MNIMEYPTMFEAEYSEGEGRLLPGPKTLWIVMEQPRKMIWQMSDELLEDMAGAMNEDRDKMVLALNSVLSWAHDIAVRVLCHKEIPIAVRLQEILIDAVVTKVEPYCSELRAAKGRVLKVVQRLFDGNTPQLESQYIIGIPWSRRDLKRHWASSVHKRVKVRKSVLPKETASTEFKLPAAVRSKPIIVNNNQVQTSPPDAGLCTSSLSSTVPNLLTEDGANVKGASHPTHEQHVELSRNLESPRRPKVLGLRNNSCDIVEPNERSFSSGESDFSGCDIEEFVHSTPSQLSNPSCSVRKSYSTVARLEAQHQVLLPDMPTCNFV